MYAVKKSKYLTNENQMILETKHEVSSGLLQGQGVL